MGGLILSEEWMRGDEEKVEGRKKGGGTTMVDM